MWMFCDQIEYHSALFPKVENTRLTKYDSSYPRDRMNTVVILERSRLGFHQENQLYLTMINKQCRLNKASASKYL
jgi:hypothetical protein